MSTLIDFSRFSYKEKYAKAAAGIAKAKADAEHYRVVYNALSNSSDEYATVMKLVQAANIRSLSIVDANPESLETADPESLDGIALQDTMVRIMLDSVAVIGLLTARLAAADSVIKTGEDYTPTVDTAEIVKKHTGRAPRDLVTLVAAASSRVDTMLSGRGLGGEDNTFSRPQKPNGKVREPPSSEGASAGGEGAVTPFARTTSGGTSTRRQV